MTEDIIKVFGTSWCGDCIRARRYLRKNNIPYKWVDIDHSPEGEHFVLKTNQGMRSVPTILFPDGTILVEPSNEQLSEKLIGSIPSYRPCS